MGRHAAPGDDEPEDATTADTAVLPEEAGERPPGSRPSPTPRGRHSHPDEDDSDFDSDSAEVAEAVTGRLPDVPALDVPADEPVVDVVAAGAAGDGPAAKPAERPAGSKAARKEGATAADWRLMRTDSALRSRVIAAVVAPFVLYFLVLAVIGRLDATAVWIWLPLITAGITAGVLLDKAHAKSVKAATAPEKPSAETEPPEKAD